MSTIPTFAQSRVNFNFRWSCSGPFPFQFWIISTAGDAQPLWAILPSFFPCCDLCLLLLILSLCLPQSLALFSLWPSIRYLKTVTKLPLYHLFCRLNKPGSLSHSLYIMYSSPPANWTCTSLSICLLCWEVPTWTVLQMQPHKYQTEKNNNFLQPAGYTFANTDHYGVSFHHQGPDVTCSQFVVHQNSQDLLMELLSSWLSLSLYCCMGLTPSQIQNVAFTFVKLHEVSVSPFLKLVKTPLKSSLTL